MDTVNTQTAVSTQQVAVKIATNNADSERKRNEPIPVAPITTTTPQEAGRQENAAFGNSVPVTAAKEAERSGQIDQAVSELNDYIQNIQRDLEFSVDDESGRTVVKVIDSESKETIRQIPSDEVLELAKAIKEVSEGSLLHVEA